MLRSAERMWGVLDRVPDAVLRHGMKSLLPAALFPELQPHPEHPSRRIIVNSAPTQPDAVNLAHQRFSRLYPHGRLTLQGRTVEGVLDGLGDRRLDEVTFYGHGLPGAMEIGDERLSLESIRKGGTHYTQMKRLKERLLPGASVYLRGGQCFKGERGKAFGQALADLLGCRVVGHTQAVGGPSRRGEVSYKPQA